MNLLGEREVRSGIKKYFGIHELVGKRTRKKYGERSWRFLDYRLLYAMLIIREGIGRGITVNSGRREQRGLRTVVQSIIKNFISRNFLYISAHMMGKAVDFDVDGMTAVEVRNWIRDNAELFPFKIRLEGGVSWVHLDVIHEEKNTHVYTFSK